MGTFPSGAFNPKMKFKRPICSNLPGANYLEKSHQTALGMVSIISKSFRSSILPHLDHFNFAFQVKMSRIPLYGLPGDDLTVAQEFAGEGLRGLGGKPDDGVGTLLNRAGCLISAHVRPDPTRAN